jgi:hypothetical protein
MTQQVHVFELNPSRGDRRMLWAYRYCTGGRAAKRIQRGGFACEQDARAAAGRRCGRERGYRSARCQPCALAPVGSNAVPGG